ncbi:MAG: Wzz/FepE/Etk N-terminal domain-containing protein [Planctomycetota bacterium]
MASSQDDTRNNQPDRAASQQQVNSHEDEIDLADYLRILWKRRHLIVLGSVLPALLVGLILFFLPGNYRVTYIYDIERNRQVLLDRLYDIERDRKVLPDRLYRADEVEELISGSEKTGPDEHDLKVLLERFYSEENLNKLTAKLRESGVDEYASELSQANVKLETSGGLLTVTVIGETQEETRRISATVRDNLEKVIPVFSVKDRLRGAAASAKSRMSDIERNRFYLQLELQKKRAILAKLRNLEPAGSNSIPDGVVLHFNHVRESSEYLPLAYQAQATDANIINIEETISVNQAKHTYYESLLSLNERLADEIENRASSYYTIEQYHSLLADLTGEYKDSALADHLNAYIKEIENLISTNTPLVAKPRIYLIPKDRATIVFVLLLMITTFGVFLLESVERSKTQAS